MYGCAAALAHTRVRQPINRMAYPRLFKWGTFAGKTSPFPIASLTGQQVIKKLTVERNEMETASLPEDTSTIRPVASLSLLHEIAALIKSQELKFDQLNTHLNDQMRQIEEIMCYIHRRDDPVSHEEGAAGPTSTFSEHVHAQPPMMHEYPVTQQEWAAWPPTYSQHVPDVTDVQPPMTNDEQAPPIGHFEEDIITVAEDVHTEDPNSMVRAIKEREDRHPGLYDQSPYVREKPVTIPDKEKAVATEEPGAVKWVCKGQLKGKHNVIVESFLETCGSVGSEPDFEIFEFANGLVIRKSHILNLLYGCMTEDTVIDGLTFLLKMNTGNTFHKFVCFPTIVVNHIHGMSCSTEEKAAKLLECYYENKDLETLQENKWLFFTLHSRNHWHLFAVDTENQIFVSYNSLKSGPIHKASAKKWATTIRRMLKEYGAFPDAAKWDLRFDTTCPQQASGSLNCAIFVVIILLPFPLAPVPTSCDPLVAHPDASAMDASAIGRWQGRLEDMDRIPGIFTFKNDAY
ncbi:hypothetical protein Taro_010965, partial [Colocasia esculenta]|nr:hypothetical protein [Colocasia esculenta]